MARFEQLFRTLIFAKSKFFTRETNGKSTFIFNLLNYWTKFTGRASGKLLKEGFQHWSRAIQQKKGFLGVGGASLAASFWKQKEGKGDGTVDMERKLKAVAHKADILYTNYLIDNVYSGLKPFESYDDPEILWRLARATCELAKQSSEKKERRELMEEGFGYIQRALDIQTSANKEIFAVHKWYAILLQYTDEYGGTKQQIKNSYRIKEHLEKALKIDPADATTWNILGQWHYTVADLPYYQRKLAAMFFDTPPESSFAEALKHFEKAESIDPGFYSMNLLMLAKCYVKLGQTEKARKPLEDIMSRIIVSPDDMEAKKEAIKLYEKCKM